MKKLTIEIPLDDAHTMEDVAANLRVVALRISCLGVDAYTINGPSGEGMTIASPPSEIRYDYTALRRPDVRSTTRLITEK